MGTASSGAEAVTAAARDAPAAADELVTDG
jgi:hypothetical protein